ncbi:MAG TPA: DEAD/DEAH box helicase, partial [Polyangium sp.]|nr:DEAD/DEAH box helicase [Polyangium sp.]
STAPTLVFGLFAGALADMIAQLRQGSMVEARAPDSLRATLRPYQLRGLSWLSTMSALGLGACLADDMGLGKTIQFLAHLLQKLERAPQDRRPALLIAPTSVVGNWEREVARFAPGLQVYPHYGPARAKSIAEFPQRPEALVITTYGLLRRDAELLAKIDWSVITLDEAQNIKNASSTTARAARTLRASHRFVLTGTPVENRLSELWSILEFANPGFLGPLEAFRRDFAVPIERYGNEKAAERLRRIVGPFILRRLKSDPTVVQDLPAKNEMKVICTLTREQASLYKAVVDREMNRIEDAEGIERRGRVLALLMATKQICNHPAQYLHESGPLPKRSGKLARLSEMLDEAIAAGDKALVFTQFREMGERLVPHLETQLGCEVLFLHGGTPKQTRDEMVRRFQDEPQGPKVFVLSVKAGGTGLNLTAATHVFHYDRWWNPAVEDQATDRAYRIGQKQSVQVHKFVCAGTVEEKIDRLLEQKRDLASKVVGSGEQWITEMNTRELRDLFALSEGPMNDEDDVENETVPMAKPKRNTRKVGMEVQS